ncbi:MAG: hypothetical protein HWD59_01535 [Coxiellaceae bacterium]|nr:MAG: hypothetical protein HWD59_01535 [Coxiellaceae bacterium]
MSKLIDLIRSNKFEQAKQLLKDENEIVTESELSSIISFGSRHDDRRANCQELVPLVCARLLKNNQPLSEQYITDVIKVFDSKSVEVIVDVVVKTGGKVTEKL